VELFQGYEWPGNIRELENMVKRTVILQDEQLVVRELTKTTRLMPATVMAVAGSGGAADAIASDKIDEGEDEDEVPAPANEDAAVSAPTGSRLADIAKAASLKAERTTIEDTLRQVHWNRRRAAEQLGVSYKTLLNKIKECGISRK
jgi:DNA-binding NtrC family response regulator